MFNMTRAVRCVSPVFCSLVRRADRDSELQATEKYLADLSEARLAGQPVFFRLATAVHSVKK